MDKNYSNDNYNTIITLLLQRNETDKNYSNDNYITIITATIYENYIHKLFLNF